MCLILCVWLAMVKCQTDSNTLWEFTVSCKMKRRWYVVYIFILHFVTGASIYCTAVLLLNATHDAYTKESKWKCVTWIVSITEHSWSMQVFTCVNLLTVFALCPSCREHSLIFPIGAWYIDIMNQWHAQMWTEYALMLFSECHNYIRNTKCTFFCC
jgi:hypothetical protein